MLGNMLLCDVGAGRGEAKAPGTERKHLLLLPRRRYSQEDSWLRVNGTCGQVPPDDLIYRNIFPKYSY